jgi:hypothetical protein
MNWPHEEMHRVKCVECVEGYRVFSSFHIFIPSHRFTSNILCAEHPELAGIAGAMAKRSIRYSLFAIRYSLVFADSHFTDLPLYELITSTTPSMLPPALNCPVIFLHSAHYHFPITTFNSTSHLL